MRDGECSVLPMPSGLEEFRAWITRVIESGSLRVPTVTNQDSKNNGGPSQMERNTVPLNALVKRLPTLHGFSKDGSSNGPSGNELGRAVNRLPSITGGSLNPPWVEWLMGWPIGWSDLRPLEMDKFQQWLGSHGKS
jgi:hypothetical protein